MPTLARGKTRRSRDKAEAEITAITAKPWVRRVITWQLDGEQPKGLRLAWGIDTAARAALEEEIFGKHVLITSHDHWPAAEVIAGYRSQSDAGFSCGQLKPKLLDLGYANPPYDLPKRRPRQDNVLAT